jgi:hypothetical protein
MTRIALVISLALAAAAPLSAQYYFFGRNKVQYDEFEWKKLETAHFDVYYYDEMGEIAVIGANIAEAAYDSLRTAFNHVPKNRVPLIFYNTTLHFQQTNTTPGFIPEGVGGFFEFLKGRVVLPFDGSYDNFRHVIWHELTHVFFITKLSRMYRDRRRMEYRMPPLWFVEGLSEHYSAEWDDLAESTMRDAVINGYFAGLQNLYQIRGSFLMYKEGQSFLLFVGEEYGAHKIQALVENLWMSDRFEEVLERTLGEPIEEIDRKWTAHEREKYYPVVAERKSAAVAAEAQTREGYHFNPIYFADEDTTILVTMGNVDGYASIYAAGYDSARGAFGEPELLARGGKSGEFESLHLLARSIAVSNTGTLVFVTKTRGADALHFFSLKRRAKFDEFAAEDLVAISDPVFNEAGTKLLFSAIDRKGFRDLHELDLATEKTTRLTNDYYEDISPLYAPDGKIYFVSDRTAGEIERRSNLFAIDPATYRIDYVTELDAELADASLSADGASILFTADLDGVRNVYAIDLADAEPGAPVRRLTDFLNNAYAPSAADTNEIVFSSFEDRTFRVYRYEYADSTADTIRPADKNTAGVWQAGKERVPSKTEPRPYQAEYALDYAQSQITTDPLFGTRGGAVLSISDLLGDDRFFFLVYNTAQVQSDFLESFNVDLFRLRQGDRANHGYGVFNYAGRRYDLRDPDEYYYERTFGGYFVLHFPFSTFRRLEATSTLANSDKEIVSGVLERKALLWSNTLAYVIDNSLWGPSGPLDGTRARFALGYTSDVKYSNVNYYSFIADYRRYFRTSLRTALATRASLYYNEGKEARRYFMGGSWDIRGWRRWSIRGEKLWLSSIEFRFPLVDLAYLRLPIFDLYLGGVRGAAFFDAGGAWDDEYRETLGSVGVGFRFNLFNVIVLRYDIGKKIEDDFTRLQDGLFYQFFFGWDF